MKRIILFSVAALLLFTGTASAALMPFEYVTGEKVILDTGTGNYWYWNLADFVDLTYAEQITSIASLGTYGYIAGGWHMASLAEMEDLWSYGVSIITESFGSPAGGGWGEDRSLGRFDSVYINPTVSAHFVAGRFDDWTSLSSKAYGDAISISYLGSWVTTDAVLVPVPPAVVLATTGMFTGMLCLMGAKLRCRWRRR